MREPGTLAACDNCGTAAAVGKSDAGAGRHALAAAMTANVVILTQDADKSLSHAMPLPYI